MALVAGHCEMLLVYTPLSDEFVVSARAVVPPHLLPGHTESQAQHAAQEVHDVGPLAVDEPAQQRMLACRKAQVEAYFLKAKACSLM